MNQSYTLDVNSQNNGIYLTQHQIDLLIIVGLTSKEKLRHYIKHICTQFPNKNPEDIIDIDNLSLEECKKALIQAYLDTMITYLEDDTMSLTEKAKRKLSMMGLTEEDISLVIEHIKPNKLEDAYKFLESKYGAAFVRKFNRIMNDDFNNLKGISVDELYVQMTELRNKIMSDQSIDTIIVATGKYGNSMQPTGEGLKFDPYLTKKAFYLCKQLKKHMRYHALIDYAHINTLLKQNKGKESHDQILRDLETYIQESFDFINKYNRRLPDGTMIINVVEVFNELVEYNKLLSERTIYEMAWQKHFGITIDELLACFKGITKPEGLAFMYNETMLTESPIRRQKVEEIIKQIMAKNPQFLDKFGDQMHLEAMHLTTESGIKELMETFALVKRIQDMGLSVEVTEFDLHYNRENVEKFMKKIAIGQMDEKSILQHKTNMIKLISDMSKQAGIEYDRTTYWSLFDNADDNLVRANKAIQQENITRAKQGIEPLPYLTTMYAGLYGRGSSLEQTISNDFSVMTPEETKQYETIKEKNSKLSKQMHQQQEELSKTNQKRLILKMDTKPNQSGGFSNIFILSLLTVLFSMAVAFISYFIISR